ncbi:hypothetical protein P8452_75844 [Trifolium repens]|nr:hypothetical protein P8452_75844 [Trifolium repens]
MNITQAYLQKQFDFGRFKMRRTRHSSFLTFAVDEFGFENPDPYENLDVFVENLPEGIEFEALFVVFQQVVVGAEITNGDVPSQKYATVNMKTVEEVEKAMNKFSGYDLNGKLLTISREKPKREQPKPPTKASRL